jgi:branched-chain amino acid transport system substrate-binding protein
MKKLRLSPGRQNKGTARAGPRPVRKNTGAMMVGIAQAYETRPARIFGSNKMKKSLLSAVALTAMVAFSGTAWADILVGVGAPLTGPNAAFGAQIQKGAEQAAEDINAAGGINGEQIKVVLGDDVSDPKQGVSVAQKFVADGVKFVVGHFNSGVSIPASEIYAENGILQVTPASTNPQYTERGLWNTFRTCGRDDQQGAVAGAYIAANFKDAKVAVIHDKTPYGQGLADETKKSMNEAGVTEALYEGINTGDKDFSALIAKMKQAGVSIVYYGGLHTEAGLIMRQMKDQGLNATMMSGDGIVSNELASIAGDAVDGTLMTFAPDPRKSPAAKDLVEKFRAAGFEPEAYTLYAYAALQVIAEGAKAAGNTDPQAVAEAIKAKGPFKTAIGELGFDEKGDITRPDYVMYTWKKGDDGKFSYFQNE